MRPGSSEGYAHEMEDARPGLKFAAEGVIEILVAIVLLTSLAVLIGGLWRLVEAM